MNQQRILIWYRNDLRVHDHEPLFRATETQGQIIPFYCFDIREFRYTEFGFPKTGSFRTQFLLESVANLRYNLQKRGSNLIIRVGNPNLIIPELVRTLNLTDIFYYAEVTAEEIRVEKTLKKQLESQGIKLTSYWGATLHHLDDLPIAIDDLPDVFTQYRKQVENRSEIRSCFPTPEKLPTLPSEITIGHLPTVEELGVNWVSPDVRGVLKFVGGESAGVSRLRDYIWDKDCLKVYKKTRNGMLGANYSSKFSPWLARGCLSPRYVYEEVQTYEETRIKNDSTYWLIFELMWRDYFRFVCLKYGNAVFYQTGLQGVKISWKKDWKQFQLWQDGKTGYPLVDANMREIATTGFMSNQIGRASCRERVYTKV